MQKYKLVGNKWDSVLASEYKSDYFKKIVKKSNLYFTSRISVNWGGESQIRCELLMLKEATVRQYDYYHLLTNHY